MSANMDEINSILTNFDEFKEFLIENNFFEAKSLSQLLKTTEENDSETQFKLIIENIDSRDQKEIERFAVIMRNSQIVKREFLAETDQSDSGSHHTEMINRFKELLLIPRACGEHLVVQKAGQMKHNTYGDVYPMTSRPRGFCIIIDNRVFDGLSYRAGSRNDANRLSHVFSQLDFEVLIHENQTSNQMKTLLLNVSQNSDLLNHDALAVIILSHGDRDGVHGTDGDKIQVDTILEYFNNKNCPLLREKPKMFFLSACRGDKIDFGIKSYKFTTTRSLGKSDVRLDHLPVWSDIFVYYSTISGYASSRNPRTGSWFGYELAYSLAEFAHREHLHDLVTIKVGDKLHNRILNLDGSPAKQAIESQTRGRVKKLYFNPGLPETNKN